MIHSLNENYEDETVRLTDARYVNCHFERCEFVGVITELTHFLGCYFVDGHPPMAVFELHRDNNWLHGFTRWPTREEMFWYGPDAT